MNYLSVCDGIGAAHVAWKPIQWKCIGASEIAAFPKAVVEHRHPEIPALGSMTDYHEWNIEPGTLGALCGGTPCQDYSIAGSRAGMAGSRGNLTRVFVDIAEHLRPEWIVWENVIGTLSSNERRDFGAFLGGLARIGYGWSYRILDAQFTRVDGYPRAIPQRRRRVWVVGHSSGRWQYPYAVLQERQVLRWSAAPSRRAGERVAPTATCGSNGGGFGAANDFHIDGGLIVADTRQITSAENRSSCNPGDPAPTISQIVSVRGRENGSVPEVEDGDVSPTVRSFTGGASKAVLVRMRSGCEGGGKGALVSEGTSLTLATGNDQTLMNGDAVRSLTPIEYERLFGFPDDYTLVPWRGRLASDTVRYRALGNSWCINQARWIGRRIELVEGIMTAGKQQRA